MTVAKRKSVFRKHDNFPLDLTRLQKVAGAHAQADMHSRARRVAQPAVALLHVNGQIRVVTHPSGNLERLRDEAFTTALDFWWREVSTEADRMEDWFEWLQNEKGYVELVVVARVETPYE